jgi:hypothetical protein
MENFRAETGITLGNTQRGVGAFKFNNGESYLISTLVKGKNPDSLTNPFNKKNFSSLIKLLTDLDIGSPSKGRLLAYDFNLGNINITRNEAGLLDLEYIKVKNIDDIIKENLLNRYVTFHCSDTSLLESNLRTFEFTGFYDYLQTLQKSEAKKLFQYYLHLKGIYHRTMASFFEEYSSNSTYTKTIKNIAQKESIHSKLLSKKKISDDIIKTEAIKIQTVNFAFATWKLCINLTFNPNQVKKYHQKSLEYFIDQLNLAINNNDYDRIIYYSDALKCISGWKPNKIETEDQFSRITKDSTNTLENLVI